MMLLLAVIILGCTAVACVKAVLSVRLLEHNAEAWEKLQAAQDMTRRRRQQLLGNFLNEWLQWALTLLNIKRGP
jgi:hypothetical protein